MIPFKSISNLEQYYILFIESGLIVSLLIFIVLTKLPIQESSGSQLTIKEQTEIVVMEEVEQTKQENIPAPPPRPVTPVEVPNDEIIEEEIIELDADLDLNQEIDRLPPPPQESGVEETTEDEEEFFIVVERMPELIGGLKSIQENIRYPDLARRAGIEGRVIVQFIVNEKGEVVSPKVIRGIGGGCDEEAIRVVKMAQFKPGKQRGVPVRVQFSLPITFILKE